jgi:hypothetical protein
MLRAQNHSAGLERFEYDPSRTFETVRDSLGYIKLVELSLPDGRHERNGRIFIRQPLTKELDSSGWSSLASVFTLPMTNQYSVCYSPHHAILLYDKKDRLISYLEICFECNRYGQTGIALADTRMNLSDEAFLRLKQLFQENGISIIEN